MEEMTLVIPSIGCQGCMNKIVNKLQTLSGIEIVHTDVPAKRLSLRYAAQESSPESIETAIRSLGHRIATENAV